MDAEVVRIIESALVVPVRQPVSPDLFGYRRGILAEETGDILEREIFVQGLFDIGAVLKCQVFLVTRNKVTHRSPFYCCQMAR